MLVLRVVRVRGKGTGACEMRLREAARLPVQERYTRNSGLDEPLIPERFPNDFFFLNLLESGN